VRNVSRKVVIIAPKVSILSCAEELQDVQEDYIALFLRKFLPFSIL
jgi:hypothetical protein